MVQLGQVVCEGATIRWGKLDYVRINQGINGLGKMYDAENVCGDRGRCYVWGNGVVSRSKMV